MQQGPSLRVVSEGAAAKESEDSERRGRESRDVELACNSGRAWVGAGQNGAQPQAHPCSATNVKHLLPQSLTTSGHCRAEVWGTNGHLPYSDHSFLTSRRGGFSWPSYYYLS